MKKFAIVLLALLGLIVAVTASRPTDVTIEKSIVITASAATVAAQLDDLHAWEAWSPWAQTDPAMKWTYAGPAKGVGASAQWSGNAEVGGGTLTVAEDRPELVAITVDYTSPSVASGRSVFELQTAGPHTQVTWKVTSHNDFAGKFYSLVANMTFLIGRDLDAGLAALKSVAEAAELKKAAPEPMPEPATPEDAPADAGTP